VVSDSLLGRLADQLDMWGKGYAPIKKKWFNCLSSYFISILYFTSSPSLVLSFNVKLLNSYRLIRNPKKNHNPVIYFQDPQVWEGFEFSKLVEKYLWSVYQTIKYFTWSRSSWCIKIWWCYYWIKSFEFWRESRKEWILGVIILQYFQWGLNR